MVPVGERAKEIAKVVVKEVAKATAGALAMVHVEIRVQVDALVTAGVCLVKVQDVGGANSIFGTCLLFSISLQVIETANKNYMKRISFILTLQVVFSLSAFAQLSRFEGTWVKKDVQMRIDIDRNGRRESPDADRWSYFRFDVKDEIISIRHKLYFEFYKTGTESTHYFNIKNVEVKGDSIVSCDIYNPPEMGKSYWGKRTPRNRHYDTLVEHSKCKFKIINGVLIVESGPTLQDFFFNGQLVDTDCYPRENYVYHSEFYNENDNW